VIRDSVDYFGVDNNPAACYQIGDILADFNSLIDHIESNLLFAGNLTEAQLNH
jgi:hypothetical protein